jgi:hypothetical protein
LKPGEDFNLVEHGSSALCVRLHPEEGAGVNNGRGGALPGLLADLLVSVLDVQQGRNKESQSGQDGCKLYEAAAIRVRSWADELPGCSI